MATRNGPTFKSGLHGAVRFAFRPMLVEERSQFLELTRRLPAAQQERKAAAAMAARIIDWDLAGADGAFLPPVETALLRLKPALFHRIFAIICGSEASDLDPQAAPEEQDALAALVQQAQETGQSLGALRESADAKNCFRG